MSAAGKLATFGVAVAAAFALGFGLGGAVGPFDDDDRDAPVVHDEHEMGER